MKRKNISKEKSIRKTKHLTELCICAALLVAGAVVVKGAFDRSGTVPEAERRDSANVEVTETTQPVTEALDPDSTIYESKSVSTKSKFRGDLILVNEDHQYFTTGDEDLVSILTLNDENGRSYFGAVDYDYTLQRVAYEPLAQMIGEFYRLYNIDNIVIYGSYRTTEFQRQLYENDLAQNGSDSSTKVAKPGFSEHESGYAVDFTTVPDYDYDGTGDYAWFNKNCCKYGFIVRYPENKENITKIQYEPWHFRYVGIPHACYMDKNGLCMEEYMELLEQHPYSGEHLEFADDEGRNYEVYFVKSDDGAENTTIPVPTGAEYDISGNNYNGFIVTVYKDGKPGFPAEKTTEASTEASTEESSVEQPDEGETQEI